eukprot:gene6265-6503_t
MFYDRSTPGCIRLTTNSSSHELGPAAIGLYYQFNQALVPEAFRPFQQALEQGVVPKIHLQGPAGCGKSITLVQLAEWARSKGWPSVAAASSLITCSQSYSNTRSSSGQVDGWGVRPSVLLHLQLPDIAQGGRGSGPGPGSGPWD